MMLLSMGNGLKRCLFFVMTVVVSARVYIQFEEIAVNYLVDQATFTEIIPNLNWKEEANARIEQIRKADLTFA